VANKSECNAGDLTEEKLVAAVATAQLLDGSQAQKETKEEGRPVTVHFRGRFAREQVHQVQPYCSVAELI
jgi:hypothetical protein